MNFLVDAQLPPALARWIVSQGHQGTHVFDLGFHTADDPAIWERARTDRAVIISKDEDFVDRWLEQATRSVYLDSEGKLFKSHLAGLAGTALARRCETIGKRRGVH